MFYLLTLEDKKSRWQMSQRTESNKKNRQQQTSQQEFIPKWILQQTHKAVSAIKFFLIVLSVTRTVRRGLLCIEIGRYSAASVSSCEGKFVHFPDNVNSLMP